MKYIALNDLNQTIRKNLWKIPHDIDFVIGVPRSGMLPATIIAEFLNVPLIDYKSFCSGVTPSGGGRLRMRKSNNTGKVLVIDDTTYSGASMRGVKESLKSFNYKFIYSVAYLEGDAGEKEIDLYLEDVRKYTKKDSSIVLYEWNVHNHYPPLMQRCIYDIDGVLCLDPCDERNEEEYLKYIKNATPLFTPTVPIGKILTYRLSKNRDITMEWLKKNGIQYNALIMFNASSWTEREMMGISPEDMKGNFYKNDPDSNLFIESDDKQARKIHQISGKPVLCVESNTLYGGE